MKKRRQVQVMSQVVVVRRTKVGMEGRGNGDDGDAAWISQRQLRISI
jgi:hypothetical protein